MFIRSIVVQYSRYSLSDIVKFLVWMVLGKSASLVGDSTKPTKEPDENGACTTFDCYLGGLKCGKHH